MNKKRIAIFLLVVGVLLVVIGFISAPQPSVNTKEIREIYVCDRLTDDARPTDRFCQDPSSAPEAKRNLDNYLIYIGFILVVSGGILGIKAAKK